MIIGGDRDNRIEDSRWFTLCARWKQWALDFEKITLGSKIKDS